MLPYGTHALPRARQAPTRKVRASGAREAAIVVTAAVVLACVFTYPYIINFSNAGRLDTNDGRWSIWVVSWVAHALTTDPLQPVPRQHLLSAPQRAGVFGGQFRRRRDRRAGVAADAQSVRRPQLRLHARVRAVVRSTAYYLVRYLTGDWRAGALAGMMFAYCPFAFVRQAHIQLLLIGFLPWCMLAFHRFIDRVSAARAIELGVVLWLTGLACAYYGIFAGGMVALGTILLGVHARRWKQPRYWGMVALAAAVCIGLTVPFFLPYLQMQEATGFAAPARAAVLGEHRRVAAFVVVGASVVGAVSAEPYFSENPSEALFPGILAVCLRRVGSDYRHSIFVYPAEAGHCRMTRFSAMTIAWFYIVSPLIASGRRSGRRPASTRCSTTPCRCSRSCARRRAPASSSRCAWWCSPRRRYPLMNRRTSQDLVVRGAVRAGGRRSVSRAAAHARGAAAPERVYERSRDCLAGR